METYKGIGGNVADRHKIKLFFHFIIVSSLDIAYRIRCGILFAGKDDVSMKISWFSLNALFKLFLWSLAVVVGTILALLAGLCSFIHDRVVGAKFPQNQDE
ncbi:MAG: hypothetical protein A3D56_01745 [Candidatus Taylorbacteria bacterium RIFCSPHIGHO2_02_FULL_45_35]|uniref:Uncharacterized protein n=1 Tax=Candidatus Taylorbacteria bacterium RIFCSPHIGHO2_02_FULL_45_35 TaxID=1802311 RepID=A0A1G2MPQ0_9BACT|nr:MAG: hypothetical protein A3D56_01745 [Candidatus Taylorbacteria bacterium RIFCSPHIGHO2_02_FULL_45_35]